MTIAWVNVKHELPMRLEKILFVWHRFTYSRNISMGYLGAKGWYIYLPYESYRLSGSEYLITHWAYLPEFPDEDIYSINRAVELFESDSESLAAM